MEDSIVAHAVFVGWVVFCALGLMLFDYHTEKVERYLFKLRLIIGAAIGTIYYLLETFNT